MTRLIDAEALKETIAKIYIAYDGFNPNDLGRFAERVDELIDNAPTVELFCHYQYDGEVKEPCVESPCPHERPQDKQRGTDVISYIDGLIDGADAVRPHGKTNAEIFKQTFGIYATELWSMKEADFLEWLNCGADERIEAYDLAIKALEESEQGKKEPEQGKFECRIKIKDLISMLLEFDMNDKATICTTDEYKENNIVISITDERYKEE